MDRYEVQIVDEAQIPSIITSQCREITNLQESVNAAMEKAEKAKESADRAKGKSAGLFQKKEAIESLQSATFDLAESQISATDAQKISFEYQEKLGKITQYLFGLGVTNLAANRCVVRELELKLKGASEEELNDLARQEIINVVKQLKAQEDIMNKQNELSKKVKQHDEKLAQHQATDESLEKKIHAQTAKGIERDKKTAAIAQKDIEQDKRISANDNKNAEQDKLITDQAEKDKEHDRLLAEGAEKDKEQDIIIAIQAEKDKEHDHLIAGQAEKDKEHDRLLAKVAKKNEEQDRLIRELKEQNVALLKRIEENENVITELNGNVDDLGNSKTEKKTTIISFIIAIVALVIACAQFFI